ncbi:MAG: PHP-associated domain-containing protein [Thermoplasmata archaeon]
MCGFFDLHVHTKRSLDSSISPSAALIRARELGLRGLALTDHNTLTMVSNPYEEVLLVPGAELSTPWGDLLALGIQELPPPGLSVPEIIDRVHAQGGAVVIPHPFSGALTSICMNERVFDIIDRIDGLEVTSPKVSVDNARARRVAGMYKRAAVGGSDAHSLEGLGKGLTVCEAMDLDGLLKAIKEARTDGVVRTSGAITTR